MNVVNAVMREPRSGVKLAFALKLKCWAAAKSVFPRRVSLMLTLTRPPLAKRTLVAAITTGFSLLGRCWPVGASLQEIES